MPVYEYKCDSCGHHEDRLLPISCRDANTDPCTNCGASAVSRIPSSPAISIWDSSRSFPISGVSDGISFPSRKAYQDHLKANGWDESSTDAPAYNKPCVWKKVYGRV